MEGFQQPLKVVFILFVASLLFGCMPKTIVRETAHYKFYENIDLMASTSFGTWTKTDIQIPKGAIVAVMAKGKVWDITDPGKLRWQPHQCLRFKVAEDSRTMHVAVGIERVNSSFYSDEAGGGMIRPTQKESEEVIECSHPFFWAPFILLGDWK